MQAAQARRVLEQAAAAGKHDVGAIDRFAHGVHVGARRRVHAVAMPRRVGVGGQDVDVGLRVALPQRLNDQLQQRLVAEIVETVVAAY